MRGKTRVAVVVCLTAASLITASCGGGGKSDAQGNNITVRGCNPQNDLIPANTTESCAGEILGLTTARLLHYDADTAKPQNDLAEKISDVNTKVFTITLKKGQKFSDGTEVKAKNFVDAWNYAAFGPNAMGAGSFMAPIEGYEDVSKPESTVKEMKGLKVVDDHTFEVTLSNPTSDFGLRLGYSAFTPMPDAFFANPKGDFGKKPIGAGPYKVVQWDANQQIVLEKNKEYAGEFKGQSDKITFRMYQDAGAAYKDVQANNLDVTYGFPSDALAGGRYKNDLPNRFSVRDKTSTVQHVTFAPAKTDPTVQNPKLKQAISMAINREEIIKAVFNNERKPLNGWVASAAIDGYPTDNCGEYCQYDKDKAKAKLAEAGGFTGVLTIGYNADSDHRGWVDAACQSITNTLGIQCQGAPSVDFKTFRNTVKKREMKGMFRAGWQMDYPSPENYLTPLYGTGGSSNDSDYSNPAFDAKLKEALAAPSKEDGFKLFVEAEKMLVADMPSIPLWSYTEHAGWSNKIADVKLDIDGKPDYRQIKRK
ncbi:peptide ABC transporter substrate-binding protein [Austwickia chelonae]|uniref:peptide ABC transporter substrate-binding protein n=1 Tax=Austwickia chelonae TaxID=100225 RepID=UPI000E278030|nr:ABC transporter substrate-binding protein [Austwickia chelonae]